jgi:serine/threonine-protein kinase
MAVVYRAHDEQLDRDVALKLVDPVPAADQEFSTAFVDEARAAAALPHPNVVTVFDAGEHDGRPFIVMELVEGGDLRSLLRARGRLEPLEAARIAQGTALGLAAMHRRGLVHCDVKPQNILLRPDGQPKLVDFGIAHAAATTGALGGEQIIGSAPYLAPEQLQGKRIGPATDVYALGIVLYELLAGYPPFTGHSLAEIAARRLHSKPRPIREVAPATPAELASVVERALSLEAGRRFADGAAVAEALDSVITSSVEEEERRSREVLLRASSAREEAAGSSTGDTTRLVPRPSSRERAQAGWPSTEVLALAHGLLLAARRRLPTVWHGSRSAARRWLSRGPDLRSSGVLAAGRPAPLVALLGAALLALAALSVGSRGGVVVESVAVPAVAGMKFEEAAARLREVGLEAAKASEEVTLDTPRGLVVTQDPPEGNSVPKGQPVSLKVSKGIGVPNLVGQHWDNVKPWLDQHGWRLGRVRFVFANQADFGKVLAQEPAANSEPVADKQSASINLNIGGPPEATKTGFPRLAPQVTPTPEPQNARNDRGNRGRGGGRGRDGDDD